MALFDPTQVDFMSLGEGILECTATGLIANYFVAVKEIVDKDITIAAGCELRRSRRLRINNGFAVRLEGRLRIG